MSEQAQGRGPVLVIIFLALLLLASLSVFNKFFQPGDSGQNLLQAEAGRILTRNVRPGTILPDLNNNGEPEQVFYVPLAGQTGETIVESIVLLELVKRKPKTVLVMGREGIFSEGSIRVIDQTPSAGYRVTWPTDSAKVARIQLVDAAGNTASDEIGLRWDAQAKQFVVAD